MSADRPIPLTGGHFAVPGNRWDLLQGTASDAVSVGVVIPYYEQPAQLALVLRALELQTYPHELIHVVIADDGSPTTPVVGDSPLRVTVVNQEDLGFRAAAARNLGAAATDAELLCFLDADTIPEPEYLRRISALPSLLPDALVVGRRRHADLTGWTPDMIGEWWSGRSTPQVLREPSWLIDAYDISSDLLLADHRSYRHVISAVMSCSRALYEDTGGMDEYFCGYGGEDWEFAHRAIVNGAVLHHARDAVAWHDGPDWGDRVVANRTAGKNAEALALARLIPDPVARKSGLRYEIPAVAIDVDVESHTAGSLLATLGSFLHEDVGVWLHGPGAPDLHGELRADDPRIHTGPIPEPITRRCSFVVSTTGRPMLSAEAFSDLLRRCGRPGVGAVRVVGGDAGLIVESSWAVNRRRRWTSGAEHFAQPSDAARLAVVVDVAADSIGLVDVGPNADVSW
jgi:GT2 family glycosyltransferase